MNMTVQRHHDICLLLLTQWIMGRLWVPVMYTDFDTCLALNERQNHLTQNGSEICIQA